MWVGTPAYVGDGDNDSATSPSTIDLYAKGGCPSGGDAHLSGDFLLQQIDEFAVLGVP